MTQIPLINTNPTKFCINLGNFMNNPSKKPIHILLRKMIFQLNESIPYQCQKQPTLLSSGISKFGYKMPYLTYFGRPAKTNEDRFKVLKESQKRVNPVGLKECKYNVTNIIQTELFTHIKVIL